MIVLILTKPAITMITMIKNADSNNDYNSNDLLTSLNPHGTRHEFIDKLCEHRSVVGMRHFTSGGHTFVLS